MRIFRRLLGIALIATIALPIAFVSSAVLWHYIAPTYYAYKWSNDFNKIKTIDDAEICSQADRDIFVYKFDNNEWLIARCETSCCSGAGYDISIIHDSQGNTYMNTDYSFCGKDIGEIFQRFEGKNSRPPKSLDDFYKHTQIPLVKRSGPGA
ncbi:MAG: hypothetical protein NTW21_38795 [Verrucomicrobia bacterium]|nr:hypothetical protein [Verrucomicrobiota bacterium]